MGRRLQLVCVQGGLLGQRFDVQDVELVLGRGESCNVRIPDTGVSREHARIFVHNGAVWVRDAGSRNGVVVNGKKIQRPATIGPGDTLSVGEANTFQLEWRSDEPERPAAAGPTPATSAASAASASPAAPAAPAAGPRWPLIAGVGALVLVAGALALWVAGS
ncbi:MAG: FHA domain-containing protein [Deltaproteobacteria bacterium]|nr:FHA domain-containing protein [Deltaproteobacteria bacterium]